VLPLTDSPVMSCMADSTFGFRASLVMSLFCSQIAGARSSKIAVAQNSRG